MHNKEVTCSVLYLWGPKRDQENGIYPVPNFKEFLFVAFKVYRIVDKFDGNQTEDI